ncbi:Hypp1424 [Branchiostoma lanceolatum]|uniref:Hypp1424 protein n=1 Tax=Branchiostoma lanceolatum TaxID=7740 RepID=A0A8K0EKT8_BRALA|nr:Hypp1424 [Branchiostoma lanceolatum]
MANNVLSTHVSRCRLKTITRGLCIAIVSLLGVLAYIQYWIGLDVRTNVRTKGLVYPFGEWRRAELSTATPTSESETIVCKQPHLELTRREIAHWFHDITPFTCTGRDDVFTIQEGAITIDMIKVRQRQSQDLDNCHFWSFHRIDDEEAVFENEVEEMVVTTNDSVRLSFNITTDFFRVKCGDDGFERYFSHIHPKPELLVPQSYSFSKVSTNLFEDISVLMLGFDSTSRLNFMRKLPKVYDYLTKEMGAVVLQGYNIVGDATAGAFIPMLTGHLESELPNVRRKAENSQFVDVYPLIWQQFKNRGYATLFAEDMPGFAAFNLRLNGFKEQPTDHYMRPFWHTIDEGPTFCYGSVPKHVMMFDYLKEFQLAYEIYRPRFGFTFLTQISHDDLNIIELVEKDLLDLLRGLYEGKHLEDTILIVFSDHGPRYGNMRETLQGKIEERLPFMSIVLPESIKRNHPDVLKSLQQNSDKLSSPFDMYATLADVIGHQDSAIGPPRAISLFTKIPANRTCQDAGIETHWCSCLQWKSIPPEGGVAMKVAHFLVEHINALTKPYVSLCHQLSIVDVTHAETAEPDNQNGIPYRDVQITIETAPGHALFEATVHMTQKLGNDSLTVTSDISRINKYGHQSDCVLNKNPELRKYCYCREDKH